MVQADRILVKPLITEKVSETSANNNAFGFVVALKSTKNQIKLAIEKQYNVKVLAVRTLVRPGKMKRYGRFAAKTSMQKKAYVVLAKGQTIELFKGV